MLHRNHFPNFFVLTLLQVAIRFFYQDVEVLRELEGRLQGEVSNCQAELGAGMTGVRDALKAEAREYRESTKERMRRYRESTKEEIREIRESTKALGTPAPRSWLF